MKKFLSIILFAVLAIALSVTAFAEETPKSGFCGVGENLENVSWSVSDDGTITFSGTGEIAEYGLPWDYPWYPFRSEIQKVAFEEGITNIPAEAFSSCNIAGELVIPGNIKSIGNYAFSYAEITSLKLEHGVENIGNGAFNGCRQLTGELVIPGSVVSIGGSAFSRTGYTSIKFEEGIQEIGKNAFYQMETLTGELVIPDSVTSIGEKAFYGCDGITSVDFGNGVKTIGAEAFRSCDGITGELVIPDNVTEVGVSAFDGCSFTSVKIGSGLQTIGDDAFDTDYMESYSVSEGNNYFSAKDGVLFSKDFSDLIVFPYCKTGDYTVPEEVKVIKENAFIYYEGRVTVNHVLDEIEGNAFYWCSNSIYFLAGAPLKGDEFSFNGNISKIYYLKGTEDKWPLDENGTWYGYVPLPYEAAEDVVFDPSLYVDSGYCGKNLSDGKNVAWTLDANGTLTIRGKGEMQDYEMGVVDGYYFLTTAPWGEYQKEVKKLVIEEGITSIGDNAFLVMKNIEGELVLPSTLVNIGMNAFRACEGFTGEVIIPEGVIRIGSAAFYGMHQITSVTIPSTFTGNVGGQLFDMQAVKEFKVAEGNPRYCAVNGAIMSKDMKTLERVPRALPEVFYIPETTEVIAEKAFYYSDMKKIVVPAGYTADFDRSAFISSHSGPTEIEYHKDNPKYCTFEGAVFTKDMKTLVYVCSAKDGKYAVPEGTETIAKDAFYYAKCAEIFIPKSVTSIEGRIRCRLLHTNIIIEGNPNFAEYFIAAQNYDFIIDMFFLNGEPESVKLNANSGTLNLYYLAGTEDKWNFDEEGLWRGRTVTKFYGFGTEDETDHSEHNTEVRNILEATEEDYGYSGDHYCNDCGYVFRIGEIVEKVVTEEPVPEPEPAPDPESTIIIDMTERSEDEVNPDTGAFVPAASAAVVSIFSLAMILGKKNK